MVMILNFSGYTDENEKNILNIEKVVVNIDIGVKEKKYAQIELKRFTPTYLSSDDICFFYEAEEPYTLRLTRIKVKHEYGDHLFYYYFDNRENLIKFVAERIGYPDNPPKVNIFFNENMKVISKNFDYNLPMTVDDIKKHSSNFKKQINHFLKIFGI